LVSQIEKNKHDLKVEQLLNQLMELQKLYFKNSDNYSLKNTYLKKRDEFIKNLEYLVEAKTKKYKNFINYDDLCQDGRLALCQALKSYDPEKGNFFWWANKYIKTKISREANKHATIRIPVHETKNMLPYKVSKIPTIIDNSSNALNKIFREELESTIRRALTKLPELQRKVIELHFEIDSPNRCSRINNGTINTICEKLNISKSRCTNILREAKENLREELNGTGV
jgi:RNA polymerase sigma factor (sigma-70 family)